MKFNKNDIIQHSSSHDVIFDILDVNEETQQYKIINSSEYLRDQDKFAVWLKKETIEPEYKLHIERNRNRKLKEILTK